MEFVTYLRKQPWRPRSPWLGARGGARRRGFRQDDVRSLPGMHGDGIDVVLSNVGETGSGEDRVLAEFVPESVAQCIVPARVDVSGLQAIAAMTPQPVAPGREERELPAVGLLPFGDQGDETGLLGRHSA